MPGALEIGLGVLGLAIVGGLLVWIVRMGSDAERTKRKHAEGDLGDRETFDAAKRKARGGAVARAIERVRERATR